MVLFQLLILVKKIQLEVIKQIKEIKLEPILLSGDNENVTKYIST
jgi:cation transport ATPase